MTQRAAGVNRLLEALPEDDLRLILAGGEMVELALGAILYTPIERPSHVYFPTSGFVALIMPVDGSTSLEVGLIGNEGMLGIPVVLGVDVSPVRAMVLGAGSALRMNAALFGREPSAARAAMPIGSLYLCPPASSRRRACTVSTWSRHGSRAGC
jgi:hypothetical protein